MQILFPMRKGGDFMLRIAVCDDDAIQLKKTTALLEEYFRCRSVAEGQIETFRSGCELLAQTEACRGFDLYILDILMPEHRLLDWTGTWPFTGPERHPKLFLSGL